MNFYMYLFIFILGVSVGSFLNVCIYRIPKNEGIALKPSHCTACNEKIKWYDLFPVISYIFLRGKCRKCKNKISVRYPLVELLCAFVWMLIYFVTGFSLDTLFFCILAAALIVVTFTDFDHGIILDEVVIFLLIVGIIFNICKFDISFTISSVIGFFASSILLSILMIASGGGMGGGDIKLMAVCGLFLGWQNILIATFLGAILAGISRIITSAMKITKKGDVVIFGPYLSMGVIIAALYGNAVVDTYLRLVNLK